MIKHLFHQALAEMNAMPRLENAYNIYNLDKNEHSLDIEAAMKDLVLQHLSKADWNRYPSLNYKYIETKLSKYCNLKIGEIVIAPGAASILAALLNYFAINKFKINIVQPSYAFLNYHCTAYNIPFTPWWLKDNLEYDLTNIPPLDEKSVLIIASPNNPTGGTVSINQLKQILNKYPKSLIILDGVYQEYGSTDYATLISEYDNLILIRSFSKAFPAAGIRLGYLCAQTGMAELLRKLILPYSVNHFALEFASALFQNTAFFDAEQAKIKQIILTRDELYKRLKESFNSTQLHVYSSEGNFLLIKLINNDNFGNLINLFNDKGIKVLNTSKHPLLSNTFRLTIGLATEIDVVFDCITNIING